MHKVLIEDEVEYFLLSNDNKSKTGAFLSSFAASRSSRTIAYYARDVRDFLEWAQKEGHTAISPGDSTFVDYQTYLRRQRQLASTTVERRFHALKSFFSFCGRKDLAESISVPTATRPTPRWLSLEDEEYFLGTARRLLDEAMRRDNSIATIRGARGLLTSVLALRAGARVSEMVNLRLEAFDLGSKTLTIADRTIPTSAFLEEVLEVWKLKTDLSSSAPRSWLFPGRFGDHTSERALQTDISRINRAARLGRHVSPSVLRHTCAVRLHESGMPVDEIARRLGISRTTLSRRLPKRRELPRGSSVLTQLIPPEVENAFEGFVGNRRAVRRICLLIAGSLSQDPGQDRRLPLNLMLIGPPSSGKTEIAKRIANALELPRLELDGSRLANREYFLEDIVATAERAAGVLDPIERPGELPLIELPPMVVFLDEIHAAPRDVVDGLLTLTEPKTKRYNGRDRTIDAANVTFIGATTEWGSMVDAFETRFHAIELETYSLEDQVEMLELWHPGWPPEAYESIALAGHLVPRKCQGYGQELASALKRAKEVRQGIRPEEILGELLEDWGIDSLGLESNDRAYLQVLDRAGQPAGIDRLANELGMREKRLVEYNEPYLIRLEFIRRGPRGRELLEEGRQFLRNPNKQLIRGAISRLRRR